MNFQNDKKICIVFPYQRLQERVVNIVHTFVDFGFDVDIIYWQRNAYGDRMPVENHVRLIPINIKSEYGRMRSLVKLLFFLIAVFMKIRAIKPDYIYCAHPHGLLACIGASRFHKSKIIYDAFEFYSYDFTIWYFGRLKKLTRFLFEKIEDILVRRVHAVFTVDSVENFLIQRYARHCKSVEVLYNVPSLTSTPAETLPKSLEEKLSRGPVISYAGGIYENKGAIKMLHLLRDIKLIVPKVSLFLAGEFHGDKIKFQDTLTELGITDDVIISGWLNYPVMISCLKKTDVSLSLNQELGTFGLVSRGNGRKFFSYMEAGLPIVAPNFGEIGLIVKEVNCGLLVNTNDREEILNAVIFLLQNKKKARLFGSNGLNAIKSQYNWKHEIPKIQRTLKYLNLL